MPDERTTAICAKCGKEKPKSKGAFMKDGKTFCCESCCGKKSDDAANVCKFC